MCGGSWNPFESNNVYSNAAKDVGSVLAQIDPGPAIGNIGAQIDKGVNDVIPGGWLMVGAIALTALSMGSIDLEPEVAAGEVGAEVGGGGMPTQ